MQYPSIPDMVPSNKHSTTRQYKKGANYLILLGALIILLKFVIATQIFFDMYDLSESKEVFDLAWYTYLNSVMEGFFQGSVLIGLGLIYNRM